MELTLASQMQATQLQQQNQELRQQAVTDGLTGLANRARFDQFFTEQFAAELPGDLAQSNFHRRCPALTCCCRSGRSAP